MDRDTRRASGLVQTANKNSQNEDPNGSHGMRDEILIQRIRGGETDLFQELIHPYLRSVLRSGGSFRQVNKLQGAGNLHTPRCLVGFTNRMRGNTVSTIRFQKRSLAVTRCLPYLTRPAATLSEAVRRSRLSSRAPGHELCPYHPTRLTQEKTGVSNRSLLNSRGAVIAGYSPPW